MTSEAAEEVRSVLDRKPASDRALALEAGVPQSTVSRIRTGDREPTPEVLEALADALGRWANTCRDAESDLRRILQQEEGSNE